MIVSTSQKSGCTKFWTSFKVLFRNRVSCSTAYEADDHPSRRHEKEGKRLIPHWRNTYSGYFPHPVLNRVQVRNSSTSPSRVTFTISHLHNNFFLAFQCATVNLDDLWRSLYTTNDAWRLRQETDHRPNPYLQHRCNGPYLISFDITLGLSGIIRYSHASSSTLPILSSSPHTCERDACISKASSGIRCHTFSG